MSFGNRVTSTTQDKMMAKVVDTILDGNVFATRMLANAKKWSGEQMKWPVKYQKNSTGQAFSGYDTLPTNASNTRIQIKFDPKYYQITASLPLDELSVNATDAKVIDLMSVELASSAQDMTDDIGALFYGTDTDNSKEFMGLQDIVDDGSTKATYGEQARATYGTLDATVTASGGTLSLAKMPTLVNAVKSGQQKPTLGLCDESVFGYYEQLLQPQERIVKNVPVIPKGNFEAGTGFSGLYYAGFPVLSDEKCTSGYLYFLNENFLNFYANPMAMTKSIKYSAQDIVGNDYGSKVQGLGFSWSDWIIPSNAAAVISHIYLGGQLISENPKRQGVLTGISGV